MKIIHTIFLVIFLGLALYRAYKKDYTRACYEMLWAVYAKISLIGM